MSLPNPVIVIPGVTASNLRDEYPVSPETLWSAVWHKNYERLALHPDDDFSGQIRPVFEAIEPAMVRPDSVFSIAYEDIVEELRHNLTPAMDRPTPVYPFAYDWRQPLAFTVKHLAAYIQEVIERTLLMRHYYQSEWRDNPKVNIVAHSMGGMVCTGYLAEFQTDAPVDKVVTLGTPFNGSFEAVVRLITGTGSLGGGESRPRAREAARLTPSLYTLLPSFADGLFTDDGLPDTLFDPEVWQLGVVSTIAEFIRVRGVRRDGNPLEQARELFGMLLKDASAYIEQIQNFDLSDAGMSPEQWLCVVGVDDDTRVDLNIVKSEEGPVCDFRKSDVANRWKGRDTSPEDFRFTGDGTVPLMGAIPNFMPPSNLVCVTKDDFGVFEFRDRAIGGLGELHGMLPNMNMVQRMVSRFFSESEDRHDNTWGRRLPGVDVWTPPLDLTEKV